MFTVIIVMQGSIGGTLGVSIDRMLGTAAGAVVGGTAAVFVPHHPWPIGAALVVCVGVTALLAAVQPRFKVAPITVAIMLLSTSGGLSPQLAALYRVLEIGVGGLLGVLATLVDPSGPFRAPRRGSCGGGARPDRRGARGARRRHREGVAGPEPDHTALRHTLAAVENAMADAERERSSRLSAHAIPAAIPRTLWRVRNDLVSIGRFTDRAASAERLGAAGSGRRSLDALRSQPGRAVRGRLRAGTAVSRAGLAEVRSSFETTFAGIRAGGAHAAARLRRRGAGVRPHLRAGEPAPEPERPRRPGGRARRALCGDYPAFVNAAMIAGALGPPRPVQGSQPGPAE